QGGRRPPHSQPHPASDRSPSDASFTPIPSSDPPGRPGNGPMGPRPDARGSSMKRFATLVGAGLMLMFASLAGAAQYPPGPGGTCTDTLTIIDLQQESPPTTCSPASGDTVMGIKGIVTGFDAIPTAFAFWIQMSGTGPWKGIQV